MSNEYKTGQVDHVTDLGFDNIDSVSLDVQNLRIAIKHSKLRFKTKTKKDEEEKIETTGDKKVLLDDISFHIPKGKILAIVGGSGSGKTTLLNTLAQRSSINNSKLKQSGLIMYNDSDKIEAVRHAYVIQQDILIESLTCYETLKYAANLRLSSLMLFAEQEVLIALIIRELGLRDCRDTLVGNRSHKGLSGGEKRRLSIGIQMLSNPPILFLDEPTTGLDAHAAFVLIKTLKQLAAKGRTFVLSVHQPRSDIFFLFDYLCLLSRGSPVYCGKLNSVVDYFAAAGYVIPKNVNPADHLVDITSVDTTSAANEKKTMQLFEQFKRLWKQNLHKYVDAVSPVSSASSAVSKSPHSIISRAPLWREVQILVKRELLLTSRDPLTTLSLFLEALFLGVILGWVFLKPDKTLVGIRSKSACLYNVNGLQGYLMLLFETYRLCHKDIKIFDRERAENSVSVAGFLIARRISKLITEDILIPTLFAIITYFMLDIKHGQKGFFIYWAVNLLTQQLAMAFSMLSVSISRDYPVASLIGNLNFTLQSFCCGFFVNLTTMPVYVKWIKYLCYVWYTFGLAVSNEFTGFFGDCPFGNDPSDPRCIQYNGSDILNQLGFWDNWIKVPSCVALGFIVGYYLLAGVFLYLRKNDIAIAKQGKQIEESVVREDGEIEETKNVVIDQDKCVSIRIRDINLEVKLANLSFKTLIYRSKNATTKTILNNINGVFQKNKINAIMGPSGSGKTSLLNLLCGKLKSNYVTEYSSSGDILFNDYPMTENLLSGICSYVLQDDDSLLPSLTVKETLMFAAKLRLPKFLTKLEIDSRVRSIILTLGLKDCQNNMIGSELVKGISGGEKRRVSIGIQLLNDPQVLFLDEPTSGLDSFTASNILTILEKLAVDEGRTIVMTIHQPRYSLFEKFGQILLLAKGGNAVFNGSPDDMVDYFSKLGFKCPPLTNFADYVLDLVSIDTRNDEIEKLTSKRTSQLMDNWRASVLTDKASIQKQGDVAKIFNGIQKIPASFGVAFPLILHRQLLTIYRHKDILFVRIFNTIGVGGLSALFYAPIKNDYIGITNILGLVQQLSSLYFIGMLNNVAAYPLEKAFFYEEYEDRVYGLNPFFFAYLLLEMPFEFVSSSIYAILSVLAVGLPRTPKVFFSFVYAGFMLVNCGESLGILFNTVFDHTGFAINVISVFLCVAVIMSGLLSLQMPKFFQGINWISPVYYSVMSSINIVFEDEKKFTCPVGGAGSYGNGTCIFNNGQEVIDGYKIRKNYRKLFWLLAIVTVCYRAISYLGLYTRLKKW